MAKTGGKSMLEGLKNMSPEACDASCKPKGGSVNSEATRSETAPQPPAQGPRCA